MKKSRLLKQVVLLCLAVTVVVSITGCGNKKTDEKAKKSEQKEKSTDKPVKGTGDSSSLKSYVQLMQGMDVSSYSNGDVVKELIAKAKKMIEEDASTQEEYDKVLDDLKTAINNLQDKSGFAKPETLTANSEMPDAFTFYNGERVTTKEDWQKRADELRRMYQHYMYGTFRDGTGEKLTYEANETSMNIQVEREGRKGSFSVTVALPEASVKKPSDAGYPVILAFFGLMPQQIEYANAHGYAVITIVTQGIATDDMTRKGAFYDVYPYGKESEEQSGALMGWTWGASKVIDALEQGAGKQLSIDPANVILTGVSRWGKAAAVAGAFEQRIKIAVPSCSGAGGLAAFRYMSEGQTYDLSDVDAPAKYTMQQNEPLSSLQSSAEGHWFNDNFKKVNSAASFPFDQHELAALMADENRYLFISGSYISEDWVNAPSMWYTYRMAQPVYEFLGIKDHIAFHMHKEGHMVTDEDLEYLLEFANYHLYGQKPTLDFKNLDQSLYENKKNIKVFEAKQNVN